MEKMQKILSLIMIHALILALNGCASMRMLKQDISWQLDGVIVDHDGNVQEGLCIGIEGTVTMDPKREERDILSLDITYPETFRYINEGKKDYESDMRKYPQYNDFWCTRFARLRNGGVTVPLSFAISLEKEYAMFAWGDYEGYYFVGACDPEATVADIMEHFFWFWE